MLLRSSSIKSPSLHDLTTLTPERAHFALSFLLFLLLALLYTPEAMAQTCRKQCKADEVVDAAGCCMALDWSASSAATKAPPREVKHTPKKSALRAQHFSAMTGAEATLSKKEHIEELKRVAQELKEQGASEDSPPLSMEEELLLSSDRIAHIWSIWLHIDQELTLLLGACQADRKSVV